MGRLPCLYQQLLSAMQLSCLLICLLTFDKLVIFVLLDTRSLFVFAGETCYCYLSAFLHFYSSANLTCVGLARVMLKPSGSDYLVYFALCCVATQLSLLVKEVTHCRLKYTCNYMYVCVGFANETGSLL